MLVPPSAHAGRGTCAETAKTPADLQAVLEYSKECFVKAREQADDVAKWGYPDRPRAMFIGTAESESALDQPSSATASCPVCHRCEAQSGLYGFGHLRPII